MNASTTLDTALAGAQLLDLVLAHKLSLADGRIVVSNSAPTGDSVLDEVLKKIADDPKTRKPAMWIPKMTRGLRKRLLAELVRKGILAEDKKKILGFIPSTRHPSKDPSAETEVWDRLRCTLVENVVPDERTAALAAVIQAADLEGLILDRDERKLAKSRLKELANNQAMSPAIARAISSVNAATTAAIMAATSSSAAACSAASSSASCN